MEVNESTKVQSNEYGYATTCRCTKCITQETLVNLADLERLHMGKIECGEHAPTLAIIFKIAKALGCRSQRGQVDVRNGQPPS